MSAKRKIKKVTPEPEKTHRVRAVVEELVPQDMEKMSTEINESAKIENSETEPQTVPTIPDQKPISYPDHELLDTKEKIGFFPLFLITLGVALLVAVASGGIYVYIQGTGQTEDQEVDQTSQPTSKPSVTSQPSSTATPVASPSANVNLSTFSVSVLNGSGRIGEAGKVKSLLEKSKFKVSYTGNATSYDFTKTQLQYKESVPESVREILKTTLGSDYQIEIGEELVAKNVYDIVVTVGAD